MVFRVEVLQSSAEGGRVIRSENIRKILAGLLSYFRIEIFARRIIGYGKVNGSPKIIGLLNHVFQPAQQNLLVPPKAGIDGQVRLEYWRTVEEGVHGEQSSQGMTDQNAIGLRSVFGLDVRHEFFFHESQERFSAPAEREIRFLLSAIVPDGVSRRQIARAAGVGESDNDQLRNLDVAIDACAHELHDAAGGLGVGLAIEQVQDGVSFWRQYLGVIGGR